MVQCKEIARWQTLSGEPVTIGDVTITPQAQALIIRLPFGGLVWNRPVAVLVERGGQTRRIPIIDVTRAVQLGLLGFGLAFALFMLLTQRGEKRK